jgi:hypothetical protein
LATLREDTRGWWADVLAREPDELDDGEAPATADAEGLRRFLETKVLPWFETRERELANRPLIREQAFGEALDPDKLERLGRYEVHLDRKLERMLSAGRAGTGFTETELKRLAALLRPLETQQMPLDEPPPRETRFGSPLEMSRVHWVRPQVVVEVTYLTWTEGGLLQAVSYQGQM